MYGLTTHQVVLLNCAQKYLISKGDRLMYKVDDDGILEIWLSGRGVGRSLPDKMSWVDCKR